MATKGPYNVLAAAGTTQATAAALNADMVMVTSGAAGSGVILPTLDVGQEVVVCNGVAELDLSVYPLVGGKINNSTANLPLVLPANHSARFKAISALDVISIF